MQLLMCWPFAGRLASIRLVGAGDVRRRTALRRGIIEAAIQFVGRIRIDAGLHRDVDERHAESLGHVT